MYPGDSTHALAQATAQMVIGGYADSYSGAYAEANTDTLAAVKIHWVGQSIPIFLFLSV
jgi:hypothetical protein